MKYNNDISHDQLLEVLHYDAKTGLFNWQVKRRGTKKGGIAGCIKNGAGYCVIGINGKDYYAHRLAYFYVNKLWPTKHIDHIDGDKLNNRISNLRNVDVVGNLQNLRASHKDNTSCFLGVSFYKPLNKFTARISIEGKQRHLGRFDTPEEAHKAYLTAKREFHSTCTI